MLSVGDGAFSDSTDLAAISAEYRIGPEDLLEVSVYGAPDLNRTMRVSDRGEIVLPLIGSIRVEGLTVHEVEAEIAARLRGRYMHNPEVSVQVKEVRTWPVYVLGEVNRPGTFPIAASHPITVLQAVALGQGFAPMADRSAAYIIRTGPTGERFHIPVDLTQVLDGRMPDVTLQPNDVVFVPTNTVRSVGRGILDALLRVVTFRAIL